MDEEINNNLGLISHKLGETISYVRHLLKLKEQELTSENIEEIKAAKEVCREFLRQTINRKKEFKLPEQLTKEVFINLLNNSDFDWTNRKKFEEFADLYTEIIMLSIK